jgi:hypothetical protein
MWERKILYRICGPEYINNEWKTQTSDEIINMFNASDLVSTIKSRRTEWLGHIQRIGRDRGVERIFEDKPGGRQRVERLRLIWLDGAESELRTMGIKRWRNIATDREEWHRIMKEARALHGM